MQIAGSVLTKGYKFNYSRQIIGLMKTIILLVFRIRASFQLATYAVLSSLSENLADRFKRHMRHYEERFAIKSLRNGWTDIMLKEMHCWCGLHAFRRELIISEHLVGPEVVVKMLQELDRKEGGIANFLSRGEIARIALCRRFSGVEADELYSFKKLLLTSSVSHKKDLIKIFYKRSGQGEPNWELARYLMDIFCDDYNFIAWLAKNGSHAVLQMQFITKTLLMQNDTRIIGNISKVREELKDFVLSVGLTGGVIHTFDYYTRLIELRQYLYNKKDIAEWEKYLLEKADNRIIREQILQHGLHSDKAVQLLFEQNNPELIDAYNIYKESNEHN